MEFLIARDSRAFFIFDWTTRSFIDGEMAGQSGIFCSAEWLINRGWGEVYLLDYVEEFAKWTCLAISICKFISKKYGWFSPWQL